MIDPSQQAAPTAAGRAPTAFVNGRVSEFRTRPCDAALALVHEQFGQLWAKFTTERAAARRQTSDPKMLELIDLGSEGFKWLKTYLAQVHIARTTPDSKQRTPRHLALSGTYKSLWCAFCEIEDIFKDDVYDLFAIHESRGFVSFGGVAGRSYPVVIRDLALKHIGILQEHSIQGHLMPKCDNLGISKYEWLGVNDQTIERFTPRQFEAVNRAFDEIEDFNYAALLATTKKLLP